MTLSIPTIVPGAADPARVYAADQMCLMRPYALGLKISAGCEVKWWSGISQASVTAPTTHAATDVHRVIKIDVIRGLMNLHPFDGLARFHALANRGNDDTTARSSQCKVAELGHLLGGTVPISIGQVVDQR